MVPKSSELGATPAAGPGLQPATEPRDAAVTERRRRVALAGHTGDADTARPALDDPDPGVRSTALGALERLGLLSDDEVRRALADPAGPVRRRACELAAERADVDLAAVLGDDDASVVEMAAWSAGERGADDGRVGRSYVGTLSAIASPSTGHGDPLCREAAVAALGAIGDPAGLPAVVAALGDKPAVRRRAAAALAAFRGPVAEAALRRCLDDRDWQVRQIAEDLLAVE